MLTNELLLVAIVGAPGMVFLSLSLLWLLGWTPSERLVARVTSAVYALMTAGVALLFARMQASGQVHLQISSSDWFRAGTYEFPLVVFVDRLSLPLVALTTILVAIVGLFSVRYLHRDSGYFRFFLLLHLFAFGSLLIFTAGSFDLLIAGWELAGITSVLLVAFFGERREPVRNALRVYGMYKISDLGLVLAVFVLHYTAGSAMCPLLFPGEWPNQAANMSTATATLAGLLFLFAAAGKAAQVPFSGWLPRAMEGPTPSSAIFYGAISVHAGAYLLLRAETLYLVSPLAAAAVITVGVLSAALGTVAHRAATDAKTSLAYATMTQLGLIFVEIGLGLPWLALVHIIGHAILRTMQFLRAPSMLHDYHRVHAAAGGHLAKTSGYFGTILSSRVQAYVYRFGIARGFYDSILDRYAVSPFMRAANWLLALEPRRDCLGATLAAVKIEPAMPVHSKAELIDV